MVVSTLSITLDASSVPLTTTTTTTNSVPNQKHHLINVTNPAQYLGDNVDGDTINYLTTNATQNSNSKNNENDINEGVNLNNFVILTKNISDNNNKRKSNCNEFKINSSDCYKPSPAASATTASKTDKKDELLQTNNHKLISNSRNTTTAIMENYNNNNNSCSVVNNNNNSNNSKSANIIINNNSNNNNKNYNDKLEDKQNSLLIDCDINNRLHDTNAKSLINDNLNAFEMQQLSSALTTNNHNHHNLLFNDNNNEQLLNTQQQHQLQQQNPSPAQSQQTQSFVRRNSSQLKRGVPITRSQYLKQQQASGCLLTRYRSKINK